MQHRSRTETTRTHNRSLADRQNSHAPDRRKQATAEPSGHQAPERGRPRDDGFQHALNSPDHLAKVHDSAKISLNSENEEGEGKD